MSKPATIITTDDGTFMVTDCGGCDGMGNRPEPLTDRRTVCHLCGATGKLTTRIG